MRISAAGSDGASAEGALQVFDVVVAMMELVLSRYKDCEQFATCTVGCIGSPYEVEVCILVDMLARYETLSLASYRIRNRNGLNRFVAALEIQRGPQRVSISELAS